MEVNPNDLLYFENSNIELEYDKNSYLSKLVDIVSTQKVDQPDSLDPFIEILSEYEKQKVFTTYKTIEEMNFDFSESLALSFKINTPYLYGHPERADKTLL
jgi:hypothetical protein